MANFETLIRNALASQRFADESVRRKVYNSSKNALEKMISSNRNLTLEEALKQRSALEGAILRIEQEYMVPQPVSEPEPVSESQQFEKQLADRPVQPVAVDTSASSVGSIADEARQVSNVPENVSLQRELDSSLDTRSYAGDLSPLTVEPVVVDESQDLPPEFSNRRRKQKRFIGVVIFLLALALLAWIGYFLVTGLLNGSLLESSGQAGRSENNTAQTNNADYITILEPADTSGLITAGRGTAEIVNRQNQQMISLTSLRDENDRQTSAKSILLRLKPGVIEKIQGKNVTVEIFARSGNSGPAQFAIECQFGILGNCGRKRFRIGLQPEAVVFSIRLKVLEGVASDAFFAINTDITSSADISGVGDTVDILYARLRTAE